MLFRSHPAQEGFQGYYQGVGQGLYQEPDEKTEAILEPSPDFFASPEDYVSQPPDLEDINNQFEMFVPMEQPIAEEDTENIPPGSLVSTPRVTPITSNITLTPVQSRYRTPTPVTPLPDYSLMLTPQLRAELNRCVNTYFSLVDTTNTLFSLADKIGRAHV